MQCQSCDAKDQVTIAGKTFCANCGTPASESPSTTSSQSIVASPPILNTSTPASSSTTTTTPANSTSSTPVEAENSDTLASELTSSLRRQAPNENDPVISAYTSPTNVPQKTSAPTQPITPASISAQTPISPPVAPINNTQPQNQQPSISPAQATPQLPSQLTNTTISAANSNSEFTSLDNKDEGIFTDDQLNALANSPGYSAPTSHSVIAKTTPAPQAPVAPQNNSVNNLPAQNTVNSIVATPPTTNTALASPQPAHIRPMNDIKTNMNAASPTNGHLSRGTVTSAPNPAAYRGTTPTNTNLSMQPEASRSPNHQAPLGKPAPSSQHILSKPVQPAGPKPPTISATPQTNSSQRTNSQVMSNNVSKTKNSSNGSAKKLGSKVASVSLSLAGLILLGVYVWQINYPNLALKVASSKAGINASLPSYVPSGWQVSGDIQSNPGSIGYELRSSDGARTIAVSEDRSEWDSQALAENYLATKTSKYTTVQSEGLTIYLYNNNQASWINHGTWYRIEGDNHGLSQDQIIKMATSL